MANPNIKNSIPQQPQVESQDLRDQAKVEVALAPQEGVVDVPNSNPEAIQVSQELLEASPILAEQAGISSELSKEISGLQENKAKMEVSLQDLNDQKADLNDAAREVFGNNKDVDPQFFNELRAIDVQVAEVRKNILQTNISLHDAGKRHAQSEYVLEGLKELEQKKLEVTQANEAAQEVEEELAEITEGLTVLEKIRQKLGLSEAGEPNAEVEALKERQQTLSNKQNAKKRWAGFISKQLPTFTKIAQDAKFFAKGLFAKNETVTEGTEQGTEITAADQKMWDEMMLENTVHTPQEGGNVRQKSLAASETVVNPFVTGNNDVASGAPEMRGIAGNEHLRSDKDLLLAGSDIKAYLDAGNTLQEISEAMAQNPGLITGLENASVESLQNMVEQYADLKEKRVGELNETVDAMKADLLKKQDKLDKLQRKLKKGKVAKSNASLKGQITRAKNAVNRFVRTGGEYDLAVEELHLLTEGNKVEKLKGHKTEEEISLERKNDTALIDATRVILREQKLGQSLKEIAEDISSGKIDIEGFDVVDEAQLEALVEEYGELAQVDRADDAATVAVGDNSSTSVNSSGGYVMGAGQTTQRTTRPNQLKPTLSKTNGGSETSWLQDLNVDGQLSREKAAADRADFDKKEAEAQKAKKLQMFDAIFKKGFAGAANEVGVSEKMLKQMWNSNEGVALKDAALESILESDEAYQVKKQEAFNLANAFAELPKDATPSQKENARHRAIGARNKMNVHKQNAFNYFANENSLNRPAELNDDESSLVKSGLTSKEAKAALQASANEEIKHSNTGASNEQTAFGNPDGAKVTTAGYENHVSTSSAGETGSGKSTEARVNSPVSGKRNESSVEQRSSASPESIVKDILERGFEGASLDNAESSETLRELWNSGDPAIEHAKLKMLNQIIENKLASGLDDNDPKDRAFIYLQNARTAVDNAYKHNTERASIIAAQQRENDAEQLLRDHIIKSLNLDRTPSVASNASLDTVVAGAATVGMSEMQTLERIADVRADEIKGIVDNGGVASNAKYETSSVQPDQNVDYKSKWTDALDRANKIKEKIEAKQKAKNPVQVPVGGVVDRGNIKVNLSGQSEPTIVRRPQNDKKPSVIYKPENVKPLSAEQFASLDAKAANDKVA